MITMRKAPVSKVLANKKKTLDLKINPEDFCKQLLAWAMMRVIKYSDFHLKISQLLTIPCHLQTILTKRVNLKFGKIIEAQISL